MIVSIFFAVSLTRHMHEVGGGGVLTRCTCSLPQPEQQAQQASLTSAPPAALAAAAGFRDDVQKRVSSKPSVNI